MPWDAGNAEIQGIWCSHKERGCSFTTSRRFSPQEGKLLLIPPLKQGPELCQPPKCGVWVRLAPDTSDTPIKTLGILIGIFFFLKTPQIPDFPGSPTDLSPMKYHIPSAPVQPRVYRAPARPRCLHPANAALAPPAPPASQPGNFSTPRESRGDRSGSIPALRDALPHSRLIFPRGITASRRESLLFPRERAGPVPLIPGLTRSASPRRHLAVTAGALLGGHGGRG